MGRLVMTKRHISWRIVGLLLIVSASLSVTSLASVTQPDAKWQLRNCAIGCTLEQSANPLLWTDYLDLDTLRRMPRYYCTIAYKQTPLEQSRKLTESLSKLSQVSTRYSVQEIKQTHQSSETLTGSLTHARRRHSCGETATNNCFRPLRNFIRQRRGH